MDLCFDQVFTQELEDQELWKDFRPTKPSFWGFWRSFWGAHAARHVTWPLPL